MAQTTQAMSMKDCLFEISTDGSNWVDASGFTNEVTWDGGEKQTESQHTFDGKKPIITQGKRDALTVTFKAIYTEGATDPATKAQSAYDNDTALYARWSPRGGQAGQKRYTSDAGIVKRPVYPSGAANDPKAILAEIVLECPGITVSTI